MLLYYTKNSFSPFSQRIIDIFLPSLDGHFTPITHIINLFIININSSPEFFHFVILLVHIGTAFIVYKISTLIFHSTNIPFIAGIFYSISYSIHIKALTWNCFHAHATNTITGAIAFYFLIKYFQKNKNSYLISILLFMILTVLNSESGFLFLIVITLYTLYNYYIKYIDSIIILKMLGIIIIPLSIYGSSMIYFTGNPFPLFSSRFNKASIDTIENNINLRDKDSIENNNLNNESLTIKEMRSTYAPRTWPVLLMRTVDLSLSVLNILIIEDLFKSNFYDKLSLQNKILFKQKIQSVMKFIFIILGISIIIFAPILFYIFHGVLSKQTYPLLLIFICLFFAFIFLFNRIDIANSLALFSSIILADLYSSSRNRKKLYKYVSNCIIYIFIGCALLAIIDGYENTYFYNKSHRIKLSNTMDKINEKLGNYTDNAIVLLDEKSIFALSGMNQIHQSPWPDLSHYNAFKYKSEFVETNLAKSNKFISFHEFMNNIEFNNNIKVMIITDLQEYKVNLLKKNFKDIIYVDENNSVFDITN